MNIETFKLYDKTFIKFAFNEALHQGDFSKVPLECIFTHYVLRNEHEMFFIDNVDETTGNSYDIIHIPISLQEGDITALTEETKVHADMDSVSMAQWLKERLRMRDILYIPERKPFSKEELDSLISPS